MDATKSHVNPNPREKANIISVLLWWWTIDLFKKGYNKDLTAKDLYDPVKTDRSDILGDRLDLQWSKELENSKKAKRSPNLMKTIFRTFLREYSILGLMQILNEFVIRLGTPLMLGGLLRYFRTDLPKDQAVSYESALMFAGGICFANAINVVAINYAIFGAFHVGGRIRVAVCSVIYRKALRLSMTTMGDTASASAINLVATDVNKFELVSVFIHHMWSAPLSAMIVGYFLWHEAGYAGLLGIASVFIIVPIQSYNGKLSSIFRLQTARKTDERVRLMEEIISGVQVIKMYAWEKPFSAMVELARRLELKVVRKSSYIRGIYMTFNVFTTRMALYTTLVAMLLLREDLTADKVFVFSSYFTILAHTMSGMFVRGFAELAEAMVAVRRLQFFLMQDEYETGNTATSSRFAASTDTMNTSGLKSSSSEHSKHDLPYIDEDVQTDERETAKNKPNGSVANNIAANNTANLRNVQLNPEEQWAVKLLNVTGKWKLGQSENTLEALNVNIRRGKLYAVIGAVGTGKSSLLQAILGELPLTEGHVTTKGGLSYACQEAWVFNSTIKQNILFGAPYDEVRYKRVTESCALLRDFEQLPQGDQTTVGDRGSALSGGQKARINLARAVYRKTDIYLLDDPLSAVDTHVGKHLFEECILGTLAGKTRILVTHQLQYLKGVDAILLLERGKMRYFSTYYDLLAACPEYATLLASDNASQTDSDSAIEDFGERRRTLSTSSTVSEAEDANAVEFEDVEEVSGDNNITLEGTSRGKVKGSILLKYFQAGGALFYAFVVAVLFVLEQVTASAADFFIPILVSEEEYRQHNIITRMNASEDLGIPYDDKNDFEPVKIYIYVYSCIIISVFIVGITRSLLFYNLTIRCSQHLHDMVFGALIRTGMRFFNTNPGGRIINRFSKDMSAIDEILPKALLDAGQILMLMVGAIILACIVNPIFLVPVLIIGYIFHWIRVVFLKSSKNIKRLEGMTRSPVFSHLTASVNGLTTIRAYGAQDILKAEFDKLQNYHTSSWYMFVVISNAFGFSLDVFCLIFITIVIFSFLLLGQSFSGGEVGLAITQTMAVTGMIQWGMRQSAEVSNQLMAVERVLEYAVLPPEDNLRDINYASKKVKKTDRSVAPVPHAPQNWPSGGSITFRNVSLSYDENETPVLIGLDIVIKPKTKVGIVGRTGAGKSSLIAALFRLAKVKGVIEIDGVDTGAICLEDLRRNISIIPQDPVLFSGTLRKNLDPFSEFSDDQLWEVLDEVELKETVIAAGYGLDSPVQDRGGNYSAGQRQLVCLARAILRNNRILMLDEATANVDPHTDALIQRTIRNKFAICTVLTVAHRLNTIMDSDMVLVMEMGKMIEYDHPYKLLQNSESQFSSMVRETGRSMTEQLNRVAKQSYVSTHGDL